MNKFLFFAIVSLNIVLVLNFPENCNENNINLEHGNCTEDGKYAICDNKYATKEKEKDVWCDYKRKKQLIYFLVEAIAAFGAGHFYVGNYKYAIPKLIYWIITWSFIIAVRVFSIKRGLKDEMSLFFSLLALIFTIGMLVWYIVDVVMIAENRYTDGHGLTLYKW